MPQQNPAVAAYPQQPAYAAAAPYQAQMAESSPKQNEPFASPQITVEIPKPNLKMPEKKQKVPPNFKVDGYRFKDTTRKMVDSTSPHPSGKFRFNADNAALIEAEGSLPPPLPPTAVKGNPSQYPVEGFKFGESTGEVIKSPTAPVASSSPWPEEGPPLQWPQPLVAPPTGYEEASSPPQQPPIEQIYKFGLSQEAGVTSPSPPLPLQQQQQYYEATAPDYASVEVVQAVTRSYLDALSQRGNTEQPYPSSTSAEAAWYNRGGVPSSPEQQSPVAVSSPPRATTRSYLETLSP